MEEQPKIVRLMTHDERQELIRRPLNIQVVGPIVRTAGVLVHRTGANRLSDDA